MAWFALTSTEASLTVEIHGSYKQAAQELADAVKDEPEWVQPPC